MKNVNKPAKALGYNYADVNFALKQNLTKIGYCII